MWCVEEVGDHHGQDAGLKCDFDSNRKKWTFSSGSILGEVHGPGYQAPLRPEIKHSPGWGEGAQPPKEGVRGAAPREMVLCDLYLRRFDLKKDLLFDTF